MQIEIRANKWAWGLPEVPLGVPSYCDSFADVMLTMPRRACQVNAMQGTSVGTTSAGATSDHTPPHLSEICGTRHSMSFWTPSQPVTAAPATSGSKDGSPATAARRLQQLESSSTCSANWKEATVEVGQHGCTAAQSG